jgi:hypothetical protein
MVTSQHNFEGFPTQPNQSEPAPSSAPMWMDGAPFSSLPVPGLG